MGDPPLRAFYEAGVRVAIGTDSLASAPTLNMFDEMAERQARGANGAGPADCSKARPASAPTRWDAAIDHGRIAAGTSPGLIAVRVPDGVRDVEEYLVSGVPPDRVSWVWRPRGDTAH